MADNPINPGVTPTPSSPEYGRDKPRLGEGEEAQQQKPFSLDPEGAKTTPSEMQTDKPTPMDVAEDASRQQQQLNPQELGGQITQLQEKFRAVQTQLSDPTLTNKFTSDHYKALQQVTEKMNPDLRTIAKTTGSEFNPPEQTKGENVLNFITKWVNGSQETLGKSLTYLQETKKPNVTDFLRLQYAVQRATQRGELFSSIIGSSVSGIKTIMSTQLG
ncbi:MAG: hypothetical protein S4CHLAM123_01980 [Chlamydiales bacterium]|nr:hypothetical protein [Chlamydiales bacterium]